MFILSHGTFVGLCLTCSSERLSVGVYLVPRDVDLVPRDVDLEFIFGGMGDECKHLMTVVEGERYEYSV